LLQYSKNSKTKFSDRKEIMNTPAHQWTNGKDEVLIVKCVSQEGKSYNGFQWPLEVGAKVEAPDFNARKECGGGLHGWPWGLSLGDGKDPDWSGKWIVFGSDPGTVIDLNGKVKCRSAVIRFVGNWHEAMLFVLDGQMAWVKHSASGAASSTGTSGAASSTGYSGAASSTGYRGAASSTGYSGAASSTGTSGAASSTGYRGAASSTGTSGAASSTGTSGAAVVTGSGGRAQAGPYGCIALAWWNLKAERSEMRCALVGKGDGNDKKLKANVWYTLDGNGNFVEVA
jgi:hypothetical protein